MPTENRSNNTEMVSVPREWAQHYADLLEERCGYEKAEQVTAFLAQPAEQHQGEPVALPERKKVVEEWATPGGPYRAEGWNACLDEIAKLGPLCTRPVQGEPVAYLCKAEGAKWLQYGSKVGDPWKPGEVQVTPLYANADPGEVERLRAEVKRLDLMVSQADYNYDMDRATFRRELAERDALLSEIRGQSGSSWLRGEAQHKLDAALSASAEPSAPECATCDGDKLVVIGFNSDAGENIEGPCPDCAPSAPIERDERAVTNAFHDWAFYKKGEAIGRMDGQQAALEGFIAGADWQARAALERYPS